MANVDSILERREALDASIWREERLAQEYETAFIDLWDRIREAEDAMEPLLDFPFERISLPRLEKKRVIKEGVSVFEPAGELLLEGDGKDFASWLREKRAAGYRLEESEFHHAKFVADGPGGRRSEFTFAFQVRGPGPQETRYVLKGRLGVLWQPERINGVYWPRELSLLETRILAREGRPAFAHQRWLESKPQTTPYSIVLVEDLNGDGLSDVAFPRRNQLFLNQGEFRFEERVLAKYMIKGLPTAAMFVDLDLDGRLEYVLSTFDAPYLFAYTYNEETEAFDGKPMGIWKSSDPLRVQLLSAGDITGDGLPEIYVGQSTPAYEGGKVPTPYFDANDGRPAYLLRNAGGLRYEDITELTSVGEKRGRRAYVASFQDLDGDGATDLLVNSDFSGLDVHRNRYGSLKDATSEMVDDRSLFGMSHTFADFDRDGELDLLAVGMSSTTARRLEQMGLGREEFPEHQDMRMRIAKGNRLYYGGDGLLRQRPTSDDVARSGWSWGSSSLDFNNDSYPDLFISNGYLSKSTARDYCSTFWTHDIYTEPSVPQIHLDSFYDQFGPKALVGGNQMGWNPFEKDHLYVNLDGDGFVNIGYLMGVANGGDGRAVIGEDFDLDGRVDLLLVEQDSLRSLERVHCYRNERAGAGNWLGIDLAPGAGQPVLGARVEVATEDYVTQRVYTIGEAYAGQFPRRLHFGLGERRAVQSVRVLWPDGRLTTWENPPINQYHRVGPVGPAVTDARPFAASGEPLSNISH